MTWIFIQINMECKFEFLLRFSMFFSYVWLLVLNRYLYCHWISLKTNVFHSYPRPGTLQKQLYLDSQYSFTMEMQGTSAQQHSSKSLILMAMAPGVPPRKKGFFLVGSVATTELLLLSLLPLAAVPSSCSGEGTWNNNKKVTNHYFSCHIFHQHQNPIVRLKSRVFEMHLVLCLEDTNSTFRWVFACSFLLRKSTRILRWSKTYIKVLKGHLFEIRFPI